MPVTSRAARCISEQFAPPRYLALRHITAGVNCLDCKLSEFEPAGSDASICFEFKSYLSRCTVCCVGQNLQAAMAWPSRKPNAHAPI